MITTYVRPGVKREENLTKAAKDVVKRRMDYAAKVSEQNKDKLNKAKQSSPSSSPPTQQVQVSSPVQTAQVSASVQKNAKLQNAPAQNFEEVSKDLLNKMSPAQQQIAGPFPSPPVKVAGKLTKKNVKTPHGPRKVRLGPRGGKYVLIDNKKVSVSKLPKCK